MKIIHAIFTFMTGGSETMLVDIINHQCKEASVALIVVNDKINPDLLKTLDKNVAVYLLGRTAGAKSQLLPTYFKIRKIVNRMNPDVIHCHDNNLFPFFIRWKQKTFLTIHSVQLSTAFLKNYRQVFAISTPVKADIKKRTGIEAKMIYNGITIKEYQSRNRYDFDPEQEIFQIIQISRLDPVQKGQDIAIQSMRLLKEQHPGIRFHFDFVGDGDALEELQALVTQNNLQNEVLFVGQVDRNWIKTHLQNYHLLIQPSLIEGFGLTIIEGFACGLPVIASDLYGPEEICRTLDAGLLVHPNDPVDLAKKIYQVYQSYTSNTLKDTNYCLQDKNRMSLFDIQTTAKTYMDNYIIKT